MIRFQSIDHQWSSCINFLAPKRCPHFRVVTLGHHRGSPCGHHGVTMRHRPRSATRAGWPWPAPMARYGWWTPLRSVRPQWCAPAMRMAWRPQLWPFRGKAPGLGMGDGGRGGCGGFLLVSFLFGLGRCHADEGSDFWRWTDELGLKKFTCAAPSTMQQLQGKFLASGSSSGHVVLQLGLPTYCCLNCF